MSLIISYRRLMDRFWIETIRIIIHYVRYVIRVDSFECRQSTAFYNLNSWPFICVFRWSSCWLFALRLSKQFSFSAFADLWAQASRFLKNISYKICYVEFVNACVCVYVAVRLRNVYWIEPVARGLNVCFKIGEEEKF